MQIRHKYYAIILAAVVILFPYTIVNEEKAPPLFLLLGIVFILLVDKYLLFLKNNKIDKVYLLLLLLLSVFGIVSISQSNNVTKTLNGLCIYLSVFVYYILFSSLISWEKIIVKTLLYCSAVSSLIFVVYQGGFLKLRIYGNLGYANSYALIILIMLILNELYITHKTYAFLQIIK